MATNIHITYHGNLRCETRDVACGQTLATDAPLSYGGKGEMMSPTDLVAAALGSCVMTVVGLVGEQNGVNMRGTKLHVAQEMGEGRIGKVDITIEMPAGAEVSDAIRKKLERAANSCPVKKSLSPDIKSSVTFKYAE